MPAKTMQKSEVFWKQRLSHHQYRVLRDKETEPAFCGALLHNKKGGAYKCAACKNLLFTSKAKFDSGTGWPSFFQPASKESVGEKMDFSYGMVRKEVLCAKCNSHLGHVFNDGPPPTGKRYCMNSIALEFEENNPKKK